ncbi:hypothetical protein evm_013289 [Chilo suppressalis]|nr:hypothetical protein evm_013289 [Chilo suppressalis]
MDGTGRLGYDPPRGSSADWQPNALTTCAIELLECFLEKFNFLPRFYEAVRCGVSDASQYAHFVFNTIKHKQSGKVNFEEFLEILSRVARGSVQEKVSWVFALYDVDGDGRISRAEMLAVVRAIYCLLGRAAVPALHAADAARDHVDRIFHLIDTNADGVVTLDELTRWCARDPDLLRSLDTLDTVL